MADTKWGQAPIVRDRSQSPFCDHLQSPTGAVARLQIAPVDAQLLDQSLPRLPGNDDASISMTLRSNAATVGLPRLPGLW